VGGLVYTAPAGGATAADIAQAISDVASGTPNNDVTGSLTNFTVDAYTAGSPSITVTSTTNGNVTDLVFKNPVQTDALSQIENLAGSNFSDYMIGGTDANKISGGDGSDTLDGGAGADTL